MNAEKYIIRVNGQSVEVNEAIYTAYTKGGRKMRYFENDLKMERTVRNTDGTIKQIIPSREDSLDRLMTDNAMQFPDETENVEEAVLKRASIESMHKALNRLSTEEHYLINLLFFQGMTERGAAKLLGISGVAVHKRKHKILQKLKLNMEKMKI